MENKNLSKPSSADESSEIEDGYYAGYADEVQKSPRPANSFLSWYSSQMDSRPVLTKTITGGCSAIVGDLLAQYIEYNIALVRAEPPEEVQMRRVIAMFMTGLTYGPLLHYVYDLYEHIFPIDCDKLLDNGCNDSTDSETIPTADIPSDDRIKTSTTIDVSGIPQYSCTMFYSFYTISQRKYMNAFLHVAIDQGIMAFLYVAVMMAVTGVVEGQWKVLREEFHDDYIDNVHALWIAALVGIGPIQLIAFRYLSLKWRCFAVNILDVFEVMAMSFITHRNRE